MCMYTPTLKSSLIDQYFVLNTSLLTSNIPATSILLPLLQLSSSGRLSEEQGRLDRIYHPIPLSISR
jgi:hypothetical protein